MSYVALLIIFGNKAGHSADWTKTSQYSRFHKNKKSRSSDVLPLVQEWLRAALGRGKIGINAFGREKEAARGSPNPPMILIVLLLGLAVGVLVGLLGIGGGVLLVPALVYLLHMDQHLAQGTSLLILLPPVGLGALREYWKRGQVDLRAGILCALGMLVGGYLGGLIAVPLASRHLKGFFGCFLILAAFLLWRKPQAENRGTASPGRESLRV
jgi:uncharacterized protein